MATSTFPKFRKIENFTVENLRDFNFLDDKQIGPTRDFAIIPVPKGRLVKATYEGGQLVSLTTSEGVLLPTGFVVGLPDTVKHLGSDCEIIGVLIANTVPGGDYFCYLFECGASPNKKSCYKQLHVEYAAAKKDGFSCYLIPFIASHHQSELAKIEKRVASHKRSLDKAIENSNKELQAWFERSMRTVQARADSFNRRHATLMAVLKSAEELATNMKLPLAGWLITAMSQQMRNDERFKSHKDDLTFMFTTA